MVLILCFHVARMISVSAYFWLLPAATRECGPSWRPTEKHIYAAFVLLGLGVVFWPFTRANA